MSGQCCCGGDFCAGGMNCGCGAGFEVAPAFVGYSYGGSTTSQTAFEGALKFDLKGSSKQDPSSFWQRHFEGSQSIEQLSYSDFFDRIRATLCQLGFKKTVYVRLDHVEVYNYKISPDSADDLGEGIAAAQRELGSPGKAIPHKVDLSVARKTDSFHELLLISYSMKHDSDSRALRVYIEFAPNDAVWNKTESLVDFENRISAKYSKIAAIDFLNIYERLQSLFPLAKDNQAIYLEDTEGNPIPLAQGATH